MQVKLHGTAHMQAGMQATSDRICVHNCTREADIRYKLIFDLVMCMWLTLT